MAKKQAVANEAMAPARAAKPKTPRVKAAQHSKVSSAEPAITQSASEEASETIAEIAYGFWESRGRQSGTALEDWVRAEREYMQRQVAARL